MERPLIESAVRKWKSEINEIIYKHYMKIYNLIIITFDQTGGKFNLAKFNGFPYSWVC